jgi:hypothetical protein
LEVIHSDQCIGHGLKYCSKNSDDGQVSLKHGRSQDRPVSRSQRLEYFGGTRISSGSEYFPGFAVIGAII